MDSIKDVINCIFELPEPPQEYLDRFNGLAKRVIDKFANDKSADAANLMTTVLDVLLKLNSRVMRTDEVLPSLPALCDLTCQELVRNESLDPD